MQVIGTSAAGVLFLPSLLGVGANYLALLVMVIMYALLVLGFLSGMWLWNFERRGFEMSLLVQVAQIPALQASLLSYKFVFGLGVTLYFYGPGPNLNLEVGSRAFLFLFPSEIEPALGFNLIPLIALAILMRNADLATTES